MTKRRIVNGLVFVWTRRGWRQVKDGCIRTRKGWRLMRRGRQKPKVAGESASEPEPMIHQWRGKYDVLRPGDTVG
jgi:hypothetical protein